MNTLDVQLQIHPDVFATRVEDQAVILQYESGIYYTLDEVGTRVWDLLTEGKTLHEIIVLLLQEYEVSEDQLQQDLTRLVQELQKEELIL